MPVLHGSTIPRVQNACKKSYHHTNITHPNYQQESSFIQQLKLANHLCHLTDFPQTSCIDNKTLVQIVSSPAHDNLLQPPHHLHSSLSLKRICFLSPHQPSRRLPPNSCTNKIIIKCFLIPSYICFNDHTIIAHRLVMPICYKDQKLHDINDK